MNGLKGKGRGAAVAVVAALAGCAMFGTDGRTLSTSPDLPAAEGKAWFGKTQNDNVWVNVEVKHLAHPDKLTPPGNVYVVWTRANKDAEAQNIGALVVGPNLTGLLRSDTALHSFDLFVTAEASGQVQKPTGAPILWTSYSR